MVDFVKWVVSRKRLAIARSSVAMVDFVNLGSVVLLGREKTSYVEFL